MQGAAREWKGQIRFRRSTGSHRVAHLDQFGLLRNSAANLTCFLTYSSLVFCSEGKQGVLFIVFIHDIIYHLSIYQVIELLGKYKASLNKRKNQTIGSL
jgi:hypothetical protein